MKTTVRILILSILSLNAAFAGTIHARKNCDIDLSLDANISLRMAKKIEAALVQKGFTVKPVVDIFNNTNEFAFMVDIHFPGLFNSSPADLGVYLGQEVPQGGREFVFEAHDTPFHFLNHRNARLALQIAESMPECQL